MKFPFDIFQPNQLWFRVIAMMSSCIRGLCLFPLHTTCASSPLFHFPPILNLMMRFLFRTFDFLVSPLLPVPLFALPGRLVAVAHMARMPSWVWPISICLFFLAGRGQCPHEQGTFIKITTTTTIISCGVCLPCLCGVIIISCCCYCGCFFFYTFLTGCSGCERLHWPFANADGDFAHSPRC
jgi:hypothetical protein